MSYNFNHGSSETGQSATTYTVGDIGAKIVFDLNRDLSTLAAVVAVSITARPPSGSSKTWTATITPSAATSSRHSAIYTTVSGDLDEIGIWYLTPVLSWNSGASTVSLSPLRVRVRATNELLGTASGEAGSGGTASLPSTTLGDLIYHNGTINTRLPIGSASQVLTVVSGEPAWAAAAGGGISDGDKGDITVASSGTVWTIDAGVVTFAKMQAISADVLLGNDSSGTTVQEIACTAAARTILDDATVDAIITTLGGAAYTGTGGLVRATSPTLVTPNLDTPSALVGTNITGTAAGLTAGNVTTNANLTGPITSVGNATSVASQTGTGSTFVMNTSPTLVTPVLGVATATSINKVAITAPATSATITVADGQTLTVNGSATITNGTHSGTNTGDQTITLTGDVTGTGTGSFAATIANNAVTFGKMQAVSANVVLGNDAAGTAVQELTFSLAAQQLCDDASHSAMRTTLGLAIGTDVQAYDANILTKTSTGVVTNKQYSPRTTTTASTATLTIDADATDLAIITAQAVALTIAAPTPVTNVVDGQRLMIRIVDNGGAQTISWNAKFRAVGVSALPSTTVAGKTMYVLCVWNTDSTDFWDVLSVMIQP